MKNSPLTKILSFLVWLAGVIVSLAVGFALINKTLSVPYIGIANIIAGWIVVITTILGVLIYLMNLILYKK